MCELDYIIVLSVTLANPCDSQPCLNGGTCENDIAKNDYRCSCKGKFTGKNCQGILLITEGLPGKGGGVGGTCSLVP